MIHKYKHFILPILLSLWTTTGWGQTPEPQVKETWTLTGNESSESRIYVARDQITLKADGTTNFKFSATDYGQTFNAKIDVGLLFPPTDNTYALPNGTITTDPTQGGVVGSIPGQFGVSPTGAANYSIPIEIPSGINGMQPNVALVYNSQGGNGIAGLGWNISGMSAITRSGSNLYNDGKVAVPQLTADDHLTLDGQRLVLVSGTHLSAGAKYRTEIESYSDITYKSINGYVCFEVKTKEGVTMEFGSTADSYIEAQNSTVPLTWLLTKVTDTNGNYMLYSYGEDNTNGEFWLDKIKYTYNAAGGITTAANEIDFLYSTDRADVQTSYIAGKKIKQSHLLQTIRTISNSQTQREYGLVYNTFDGFNNKLASVNETGTDNIKYNPTVIDWSKLNSSITPAFGYTNNTTPIGTISNFSLDKTMIFADFNNDGFVDIIRPKMDIADFPEYVGWEMYRSTNNGQNFILSQTETKDTEGNPGNFPYSHQYQLLPGDINGDGITDIVEVRNDYNSTSLISHCEIDVLLSVDGQLVRQNLIFDIEGVTNEKYSFELGDFNADGIPELIAKIVNQSTGDNTIKMYAVDLAINASRDPLCTTTIDGTFTDSKTTDVNGNGYPELFVPSSYGSKFLEYSNTTNTFNEINFTHSLAPLLFDLEFGDFNGDGKTDVLQYIPTNNPKWTIMISTGIGFETISCPLTHTKYIQQNDTDPGDFYTIKDLNGDGKGDIVEVLRGSTNVNIYYYNGSGFVSTTHQNLDASAIFNDKTLPYYDINGDGKSDIVNTSNTSFSIISFSTPETERTVSTITNGMGIKNIIEYKLLNDNTVYTNGTGTCATPVVKLCIPIPVVSSTNTSAGALSETSNYSYKGLRLHTKGKGMLGFEEFTQDNVTQNQKSVTLFGYNTSYFNVFPTQQTVTTSSDQLISTTSFVPGVIAIGLTSDHRYFPYTDTQTTTDNLTGLSSTSETLSFDDWGNPLQVRSTTGGIVETKTMTYIQKGSWCKNKVETITDSKSVTGKTTYTRNTNYTYDDNGNVATEVVDPLDANKVTTEFKHDDGLGHIDHFGHVLLATATTIVDGVSVIRKTSSTYTSSGRFLQSKTNALNETTIYSWDEDKGQLDKEINRYGETSYKYNGFGSLIETRLPDGIRKAQVKQWAGVSNSIGAKYYDYVEMSGKAPVTVWHDALGREIQNDTYGLNANKISVSTEYTSKGQVYRISDPYFEPNAASKVWVRTFTYDDYGRPKTIDTPLGETVYTYTGNTNTVKSYANYGDHTNETALSSSETILNNAGQTVSSKVNGKAVTYTYYASGLIETTTPEGGQAITMEYNLQGKRTKLTDPDAGIVESTYNGYGDLIDEKQKIHNNTNYITTTNIYKPNGLLDNIVRNGETTAYTYDDNNRISTIEIVGKNKQTFTYDGFDRVTNVKEEIGSKVYNSGKTYDYFGRLKKETYPSGFYTQNSYDSYGNLAEVKDNAERSIWKVIDENARGQLTHISKGGKTTTFGFDNNGLPTTIQAAGVVDMEYLFDNDGNLNYRTDHLTNQKEKFYYNTQNQLTNWDIYQNGSSVAAKQNSITYDASTSNITAKSDLGAFTLSYGGNRPDGSAIGPHALATISGVPASFPTVDLNVTYNDFKKIASLHEGIKDYVLTYGVDDQRRKSEYYANGLSQGTATLTRYYVGNYEEEVNALGNVRKIHYLSGGAIYIQNNGSDSLLYAYSDFQGSLIALTNESGTVIEKYAYDPWGARRNPNDWTQKDLRVKWITNRGYTGHEHLDAFGIINMNGRVYDPLTAMFMSPDPYVQAPSDWLNYNRYGYCMNNPFKYTDPSGNYYFWDDLAALFIGGVINWVSNGCMLNAQGFAYFGAGALAGEAMLYAPGAAMSISGALGAANSIIGQGFNGGDKFNLGNVDITSVFVAGMQSMVTSYAGGAVGGSLHLDKVLGNISSPILKNVLGQQIAGTVTGGIFGGVSAGVNGQDILQGGLGGAKMGLITGTLGGIGSAAQYSLDHNVNIFSGKPNPVMERPAAPEPLPIPKVGLAVSEPEAIKQIGTNSVYEGIDPQTNEVKYVGITERDPQVRWNEHYNSETPRANLEYRVVETGLNRIDARIFEQNSINKYGLNNLYNIRNSIRPTFWDQYNIKH